MCADVVIEPCIVRVSPGVPRSPPVVIFGTVIERLGPLICNQQAQPVTHLIVVLQIQRVERRPRTWQRARPYEGCEFWVRAQQLVVCDGRARTEGRARVHDAKKRIRYQLIELGLQAEELARQLIGVQIRIAIQQLASADTRVSGLEYRVGRELILEVEAPLFDIRRRMLRQRPDLALTVAY